jgi:hypothetical protein
MNPQMPHIPGAGAMTDTLDFVKNLWGSMSVPGMSIPGLGAPALSIDELDKKIADLKAVEAWLNVNVAMLRGTVQALEVQRGTITALKTMGANLAEAMKQTGADEKSVLAAAPYMAAFFGQPAAAPDAAKGAAATEAPAADGAPSMPNPTLWWNVLQDQFKQAVTSAMSTEAMSGASAMAQEAAAMMEAAASGKPAAEPEPGAAAKDAPGKPRASKPNNEKR